MTIQFDDIRDASIRILDRMVEQGYIPDCTDTDIDTEFDVQDIISGGIQECLQRHNINIEE